MRKENWKNHVHSLIKEIDRIHAEIGGISTSVLVVESILKDVYKNYPSLTGGPTPYLVQKEINKVLERDKLLLNSSLIFRAITDQGYMASSRLDNYLTITAKGKALLGIKQT